MNTRVAISIGEDLQLVARMERTLAPETCAAFLELLPYTEHLLHCRWSGEGCWIPLGDLDIGVTSENSKSAPNAGELLWYPGGISETELLFPYGRVEFACRDGSLSGNHFLTIVEGLDKLNEIGYRALHHGAQQIRFSLIQDCARISFASKASASRVRADHGCPALMRR